MSSTFVKGINRGHWLHWDYYHILLKSFRNQSVPSSTYQKSDITFEICSIKYIFDQNCKMDSKNGFLVPLLTVLLKKKRYFRKNRKITICNYPKFRNSLFLKIAKIAKSCNFCNFTINTIWFSNEHRNFANKTTHFQAYCTTLFSILLPS